MMSLWKHQFIKELEQSKVFCLTSIVLNYRLTDKKLIQLETLIKAADIMNPNVVTSDSLATIAPATKVMKILNIKTLIVDRASEKDAYGIIATTDIAQAIAFRNGNKMRVIFN